MNPRSFTDEALIIRTHDFGEADMVIVAFTRHHGMVRAVARGARSLTSRFGSHLQQLMLLNIQFHQGKTLATVTQVSAVHSFHKALLAHWQGYTTACTVLEMCERLAGAEGLADEPLFALALTTLRRLEAVSTRADLGVDETVVLDAFLLQAMAIAGWEMQLYDCSQCGTTGPHRAYHSAAGGVVCTNCRPAGSLTPPVEVLRSLWWLSHDRLQRYAEALEEPRFSQVRRQVSLLVEAYVNWHIEHKLTALSFVDRSGSTR